MPTSTTPDGIVSPVLGDPVAELQAWFQQHAASVQAALTALRGELEEDPLPDPASSQGATVQSVTATAWADLPNAPAITLDLPHACWVTISVGAWMIATAGDTRVSATVSGATTLAENQLEVGGPNSAWGQVLYASTDASTLQQSGIRFVRLNAGQNTIKIRAYRSGSGAHNANYSTLQVAPVRWA